MLPRHLSLLQNHSIQPLAAPGALASLPAEEPLLQRTRVGSQAQLFPGIVPAATAPFWFSSLGAALGITP